MKVWIVKLQKYRKNRENEIIIAIGRKNSYY